MWKFIKCILTIIVILAVGVGAYIYFTPEEEPDMTIPEIQITENDSMVMLADTTGANVTTMDLSDLSAVGDDEE